MGIKLRGCFENISDNSGGSEINNDTFKKVKIKVHALGNNVNGSNITYEAYDKAKPSIYGIPIVAKYKDDKDIYGNDGDLTSHNQIIKKDKNGNYILAYDTVPLGFISPNSNIETIDLDEDGVTKTYITASEVILWKRYEATQKIIEWLDEGIVPTVSMEIGDVEGQIDANNYFQIDSFNYESVCCLGSEVEPCFPLAQIEDFEKQDFNKLYKEMINEYQKFTNKNQSSKDVDNIKDNKKGGNKLDISELLLKYNLTQGQVNFSTEGLTIEQIEAKLQEIVESNKKNFTLSNNQLETAIRQELEKRQVIVKDYWNESYSENEFYLRDVKDGMAIVIDNQWENYYGIPYTVSGDTVTLDYDNKVAYVSDWRPKEEADVVVATFAKEVIDKKIKYTVDKANEKLNAEFASKLGDKDKEINTLQSKFTTLETEAKELKEFKADKLTKERKAKEETMFETYKSLDGIEEYENIKKNASTYKKIEDMEKDIALIFVKNKVTFEKHEEKAPKIPVPKKKEKESVYGDLFEKYGVSKDN